MPIQIPPLRALTFRALAALLCLSSAALAQVPVPERRAVIVEGADFYGADLRSILDTDFDSCLAACIAERACTAFTYNTGASACFLKSGEGEMRSFAGAVSARISDTPPAVVKRAGMRAEELGFLPGEQLDEARELAANLARWYPGGGQNPAELAARAAAAASSGDFGEAIRLVGGALTAGDEPEHWVELSQLYSAIAGRASEAYQYASAAAVNAYLRAGTPAVQSAALIRLAESLETRGQGEDMIPALRLAQRLVPAPETQAALERAAALYGFRVTDHTVDADAARPRICMTFSEDLSPAADYAPYVRAEGADLAVEAKGRQLCLDGVEHGRTYRFTLRAGLPAASGESLVKSADLEVHVRDRAASVRFLGRAYVLPKAGNAAIPLVTVNLDEVALAIHRVGDRNLLRMIQDGYFESPLSGWTERRIADQYGAPVWSGTGEVARKLNEDVTTAIPVGEAVKAFHPGAYVMTARAPGEADSWEGVATQWFVVTDLGLISASGTDGLHVFARRLSDAKAAEGARLRLIAANNEVLGEAVADATGHAVFAAGLARGTGGEAPALLTAEDGAGDFAFLDLSRPGFDLSDRGVDGRAAPPPVDVFLSTERGAYRAGETVHATILARDARTDAVEGLPLTAILLRPDGVEYARSVLADQGAGGRVFSLALDAAAQRGSWRLNVHADPKAAPLAGTSFLVEDFVPERIDFELSAPEGAVALTDAPVIGIEARYLYGAPGADLAIEGEARIAAADGLAAYPGYRFGLEDEPVDARIEPVAAGLVTDAEGHAEVPLTLPAMDPVTRPLELTAVIRLRDGSGRPVERTLTRPVSAESPQIGIRPLFEGAAEQGGAARFELIAVGPDGARAALGQVAWTLSRVDTTYQWYELNGSWNYEPVTTRERVTSGEAAIGADAPTVIEAPVDWGRYELKAVSAEGGRAASSLGFSAGWYAVGSATDTPDRLDLGLDRAAYRAGDTAKLRLTAREAGTALVLVAGDRLIDMRALDIAAGETVIDLPVTGDWGPGAYVTAFLVSPMDRAAKRNPTRALGIAWAPVDPGARRLAASLATPAEAAPRGPLDAVLQIDGLPAGETAYATIAAVDLGILNLTAFEPPAPEDWYFGQRKLGVELRDLYGRLIDGSQGAPGRIRSGGDGGISRMKSPPPTQDLVAFFSGPLTVGADGRATARFELPEFNGTVRLMAVAWTRSAVGHAVSDVLVRDPVVVQAATPHFLAPGDRSRVLVELANASGPAGEVAVELTAGPGLTLGEGAVQRVAIAESGRAALLVPVSASTVGDPELTLAVITPDGKRLTKTLRLPVRANDPEVTRQNRIPLAAKGGRLTVDAGAFSGLVPGTGHATLTAGPLARFDVPGLLTALDRYPYGCTEQITSQALPLVYFDDVTEALGLTARHSTDERVADAVRAVLGNQSSAGSFGLWGPGSDDLWLDSFATDFLSRARATGHTVPDPAFRQALKNLRNKVAYAGDFEKGGEDIAYALMVLAREGMASIGDLRYYADARATALATPLAKAQLGAALALYGEQQRADAMFVLAETQAAKESHEDPLWRADYGSYHRDAAGLLALALEAGSKAIDTDSLARRVTARGMDATTTQEKSWTLLAANALIHDAGAAAVTIDGAPATGPLIRLLDAAALASPVTVENTGETPVDAVLTTFGVPSVPEPAGGNGYAIERGYYTLAGEPANADVVAQNTRLVAVLTVTAERDQQARLIVDDPLPAGFEIDNPHLIRGGDLAALDWLEVPDEPAHVEFRSDRFIAALDMTGAGRFQLAYVVRAVSPGQFHQPAATVEDMYRPDFRARTASGTVEVVGPTR